MSVGSVQRGRTIAWWSYPDYRDLRDRSRTLEGLAGVRRHVDGARGRDRLYERVGELRQRRLLRSAGGAAGPAEPPRSGKATRPAPRVYLIEDGDTFGDVGADGLIVCAFMNRNRRQVGYWN